MNKIFTYWNNHDNYTMPAYLQMCIHTWYEYIPDAEVIIINQENMSVWLEDVFEIEPFTKLPPKIQSDLVKIALIEKYGGVYMDVDNIVTDNIFSDEFTEGIDMSKIIIFGDSDIKPIDKSMFHLSVLICFEPNNKILKSCLEILTAHLNKVSLVKEFKFDSDFVKNTIITVANNDGSFDKNFHILDKYDTGNILEGCYFENETDEEKYLKLYFYCNDIYLNFNELLKKIKKGIVTLHDSWTPADYKSLSAQNIIKDPSILSKVFKAALNDGIDQIEEIRTNQVYIKRILPREKFDVYKNLVENRHINITKFFNLTYIDNNISVIEEVFEGASFEEILSLKGFNESIFLDLIFQLCDAIEFLHEFMPPLVHNDIRAENIIIGDGNLLKLTNFDSANVDDNILTDLNAVIKLITFIPYKFIKNYELALEKRAGEFENIIDLKTEISDTTKFIKNKKAKVKITIISFTLILARVLLRVFRKFL